MKFTVSSLELSLRQGQEPLLFSDLTYFWGQMGAGKSSIARLIDYCLGGEIQLSPALQAEFVSATLTVELQSTTLTIERPRESSDVMASWDEKGEKYSVLLPSRKANGEMIPNTGVETLSDLLFRLSGIQPPRVRKSKAKDNSPTVRLSIRDLLWYCYLDQDHIDSKFFNLEEDAEFYLRLKSRDVIRYIIGYHDEHVSELEAELDQLRANRIARAASIGSLSQTLAEVGIESEDQIRAREAEIRAKLASVEEEITQLRTASATKPTEHAADKLKISARELGEKIASVDDQLHELRATCERHTLHRNEIEMLGIKFRRSTTARGILSGVDFESCPRCTQNLPQRDAGCCDVCGQNESADIIDPTELARLEADIVTRRKELDDTIDALRSNIEKAQQLRNRLVFEKDLIEADLNRVLRENDSAYLSVALQKEREQAALITDLKNLAWLLRLPRMLEEQREMLAQIQAVEQLTREKLKDARQKAEADTSNLKLFADLFLDCLVRAGVPGIQRTDRVVLESPSFYPAVFSANPNDLTAATFTSLSSGGKKTLFKCCFAIALHRVAARINAPLPELLIIDSPMKNISERENKAQFEGFYRMVYELKADELANTQFILIDKEFFESPTELDINIRSRHMRPNDDEHQPLIRYYRGK